jgi:hypothetical protein
MLSGQRRDRGRTMSLHFPLNLVLIGLEGNYILSAQIHISFYKKVRVLMDSPQRVL